MITAAVRSANLRMPVQITHGARCATHGIITRSKPEVWRLRVARFPVRARERLGDKAAEFHPLRLPERKRGARCGPGAQSVPLLSTQSEAPRSAPET